MPIQKELTHDCVRLLGAQMSYQYVGGGGGGIFCRFDRSASDFGNQSHCITVHKSFFLVSSQMFNPDGTQEVV